MGTGMNKAELVVETNSNMMIIGIIKNLTYPYDDDNNLSKNSSQTYKNLKKVLILCYI